jgi:hypothetical protein
MSRLRWILLSNSKLVGNIITYIATSQLSIYTMDEDEQDAPEGYDLVIDVDTFDGAKLVSHETSPFGNLTGGTLTFDRNLKKIGNDAFSDVTKLKTINLPKTITEIGSAAFQRCSNLWQISLPENLISIGSYALARCNLDSLFLPKRVSSIGDGLIDRTPVTQLAVDSENTKYYSDERNGEIIQTSTKSLVLGCSESDIPVDGSVMSIANSAFYGCSRLSYIDIPEPIESIGSYAFCACDALEEVRTYASGILTSIGSHAFSYCSKLKTILLPSSVTSIGEHAFYGCSSLKNFNSHARISSISSSMFSNCTSLTTIELPPTTKRIGDRAFSYCTSLNNVVIPPNVTIIEPQAFYRCSCLTTMTVQATTPPNLPDSNAISSATNTIYIPADSYDAYRTAPGWSSLVRYFQRKYMN